MALLGSQPLRDKTCLITGGARRLGRASALALAQAGADVAITFRNSAREAQRTVIDLSGLGVRSFALHCDVTDEASVKSMIKEAGGELGHIDILVNNAANYAAADFERLTLRPVSYTHLDVYKRQLVLRARALVAISAWEIGIPGAFLY